MTKPPYLLIDDHIVAVNKGTLIGTTCIRYIATADSIFRLMQRAFGSRLIYSPGELKSSFIIYDKNPTNIEMFKHMLKWDGTFDTLFEHIKAGEEKFGITVKPYCIKEFDSNRQFGRISRNDYNDFVDSWQHFRNSVFHYINIDIIHENKRFVDFLIDLPPLESNKKQYVYLGINPANYDKALFTESMNNILHILWMKSFKRFVSKVDTVDENNKPYEKFAGEIYSELNPTFCILPWMHVQYKPSGQSKLCCRYDTVHELKKFTKYDGHNSLDKFNDPEFVKENSDHNILSLVNQRLNLTIQKHSIKDTFNSEYWEAARTNTVEFKEITGCHKCYQEEKIKSSDSDVPVSMRLGSAVLYNNGYLHKKPDHPTHKLEFLEVGFGNYCNLACLTCNSTLSTTWHDNEVSLNNSLENTQYASKLKREVFPKLDNLKFDLDDDHIKSLKIIKFTGGEPMINPEFTKFIEQIVTRGYPENINLEIYTNCSYIPSPKLLENLIKFKTVQLNLSIDAKGKLNDYIRFGSQWEGDTKQTVSNALDFWINVAKENKNIPVIMSTTLSVLNILEVPTLMTWWLDKLIASSITIKFKEELIDDDSYQGFFKLQPAFDPNYININILPSKYYSEVLEWIVNLRREFTTMYPSLPEVPESIRFSLRKLEQLIIKSEGNKENARLFLEYTEKMDAIRKNSINDYIPQLVEKVKAFLNEDAS